MIIKILLMLLWFILVPFVIGQTLIKKGEENILYSWLLGNILQMGVFFILAIPLILIKEKFTLLVKLYVCIISILTLISIVFFRKKFVLKIKLFKPSIFGIIALMMIFLQLFIKFQYTNINNDDASFVTLSTSMIETDKMYLHNENGKELENIIPRRALAPISAYYACISKIINIHVTAVTHTITPIIFITMAYSLYYFFGKKVFKENDSIYIFIIILSVLNMYAFDYKGVNRYLFLYTWFGRAILGGIILPFIWLESFDSMSKESDIKDWIKIFFLVNSGCLCSEMAVPLISISLGTLSIINSIRDKNISYMLKSLVCIIPCVAIGVIYILIK